ncbi:MAG: hypothetical protein R3F56_04475 [Planctomycetota bacterium]
MSNREPASRVEANVLLSESEVSVELHDRRVDSLAFLEDIDSSQQPLFAVEAWTIGLRALRNAQAAAEEARLKDIGSSLVADLDGQLKAHVETQHKEMTGVLTRFFDPKDGEVAQRLASFLADEGVLARQLDKYLAPQNSVLAQALAQQIGESSPLFKKLSPTDSEGLVKVLEGQLRGVMDAGHQELLRALDPLAEDGAVARFLHSLREELKGADEDRAKQLATALAALDANDENSLLSRLVRETHQARRDVLEAVNPDRPGSPLEVLKTSLTKLLQEQAAAQQSAAKQQQDRQVEFEKEVREALARIETRRTQDQKSTRGGYDFEDAVFAFLKTATQGAPCVLDSTASTAGVGRCKKGDAVLRFTAESAFAEAGVVFEAKRDSSYTVQRGLDELDAARKNRDAGAGVFVMARSHASDGFPSFARHGNNVLVTWDDQDSNSDAYLHAALMLGMALVSRKKTVGEPGDIDALRDIEARIEKELDRLEKMEKYSSGIQKNVDGIEDEIRKGRKALDLLVRKAQSTLRALNVESSDEAEERQSPISLPEGSLEEAGKTLPSDEEAA